MPLTRSESKTISVGVLSLRGGAQLAVKQTDSTLRPESYHVRRMTDAYYCVLHEDPEFCRELAELAGELVAPLADPDAVEPPAVTLAALDAFAKRWFLPMADGRADLWYSLRL